MHCNLFSAAWAIAFDDTLEGLAVLLPDLSLSSAEADILLDCIGKSERRLTLCRTPEKTLLLILDEGVKNLLELVAVTVSIKGKTRK